MPAMSYAMHSASHWEHISEQNKLKSWAEGPDIELVHLHSAYLEPSRGPEHFTHINSLGLHNISMR